MRNLITFLCLMLTLGINAQGSLNLEHQSGTIEKVGDEFTM